MDRADVAQVTEIDREAFPTQWPPPNYQHELKNQLAHYIVACDDEKLIEIPKRPVPETGLAGLISRIKGLFNHHRFFGEEIPPPSGHCLTGFAGFWVMANEAHITSIAVRETYRQLGVGEMLLMAVTDLARELKARFITLEVRASNTTAQGLYLKHGFTEVGVRHGYYLDNREDAIIMSTSEINLESFKINLEGLKQAHSRKWGTEPCQMTASFRRNYQAQPGNR
jgi:ribosomal-protein-alanine N-acetyltransferase